MPRFRRFHFLTNRSAAMVCGGCLLVLLNGTGAAATLINGGFESGSDGWSSSGPWQRFVIGGNTMAAFEADTLTPYYTGAEGAGQTFTVLRTTVTGLVPGTAYEVGFDFNFVSGYFVEGSVGPLITLSPGGLQFLVDGVPASLPLDAVGLGLFDPGTPAPVTYGSLLGRPDRAVITFTAGAESAVLGWQAFERPFPAAEPPGVPNALLLLDNVSITAIPEPSLPCLALLAAIACLSGRPGRARPVHQTGR